MPAQTGKSSLFKKLGAKLTSAVKKHAHDEINYGRVDLPPGIKGGVARLTKCYFKQYENGDNAGEYYLRAEGVVVKPKNVLTASGDMKVEGLVTSIMMPVCATTNSQGKETSLEENVAKMTNELKKLGADADEMAESPENLEAIAEALQEAGPYFRFSTSAGKATKEYPNPRTWENWNGVIEDFDPEAADDVDDETGGGEEAADAEEQEAPKASNGKPKAVSKAPKEDEPADDDASSDEGDAEDLEALATVADDDAHDDQADAQKKLTEIAVGLGVSKKWVTDVAKSWIAVVAKIEEKRAEAGDVEDATEKTEDEEPKEPEEGDVVKYKGAKDKKATEYEVTKVDAKKKTCDLKQIDDGKTKYLGVKFSAVEAVE